MCSLYPRNQVYGLHQRMPSASAQPEEEVLSRPQQPASTSSLPIPLPRLLRLPLLPHFRHCVQGFALTNR